MTVQSTNAAMDMGVPPVPLNPSANSGRAAQETVSQGTASQESALQGAAPQIKDRLVQSRLGAHTGLFFALRAKHQPTAAHCLRVALGASKWGGWRSMPEEQLELLEVGALLHDIGKVGVPDAVLQYAGDVSDKEELSKITQLRLTEELLRGAGASEQLVQIVLLSKYHERHLAGLSYVPQDVVTRAGMLAIVDAFDSMTNQQVYRQPLSRDRALEELFSNAGTQFNLDLVRDFAELVSQPRKELETALAGRWLSNVCSGNARGFGSKPNPIVLSSVQNPTSDIFHNRLLDALLDAVVYFDVDGKIIRWNRAAEQLTGHRAETLAHRRWDSELMGLQSVDGQPLTPATCPITHVRSTNTQADGRFRLVDIHGEVYVVQVRALPVFSEDGECCGSTLLIRDASAQANLEEKVQSLHTIATIDSLTKVANRAEFNRYMPNFLSSHLEEGRPGSLIICDIDFFKRINDTHGHQAGDEALVTFAGLLREGARDEDLVARFGGEEFVVVCAGCDNAAAMSRAEEMRERVERTPVPALGGKTMTSSFGVTEIQPGDSDDTLLARADRALMMAKESGRNRVVQLGSGRDSSKEAVGKKSSISFKGDANEKRGWLGWFSAAGETLASAEYLAAVPKGVAIQKLEGFINDHQAELVSIEQSTVVIRVDRLKDALRRNGERPTSMLLNVEIQNVEVRADRAGQTTYSTRTRFSVTVRPYRARDRRSEALSGQASQLLQSFQAYLVAQEIDDEMRQRIIEPR